MLWKLLVFSLKFSGKDGKGREGLGFPSFIQHSK